MKMDAALRVRIPKCTDRALRKAAKEAELSLSQYLRLMLDQVAKTPFRVKRSRLNGR